MMVSADDTGHMETAETVGRRWNRKSEHIKVCSKRGQLCSGLRRAQVGTTVQSALAIKHAVKMRIQSHHDRSWLPKFGVPGGKTVRQQL